MINSLRTNLVVPFIPWFHSYYNNILLRVGRLWLAGAVVTAVRLG